MENPSNQVLDVTTRLALALPDFLPDWTGARLYLVSGQGPWRLARAPHARGGLPASTVRKISEYIEREISNSISLHDLASVAGLSDCHFARAFKQSTGVAPHRYLMDRRVEKAAALIQQTDRSLAEIALEVGFCDQSHFSRSMVRATGRTPRELRRETGEAVARKSSPGVVA